MLDKKGVHISIIMSPGALRKEFLTPTPTNDDKLIHTVSHQRDYIAVVNIPNVFLNC